MARISIKDSGKFSNTGANDFFALADDGDVASVRFLYECPEGSDVDYYLVHEVEVEGKKRYAACIALDDDGNLHPGDCPLCQGGYRRVEKLFLQLFDESDEKVKTWDRGKSFVQKIMTYINRYGSLVAQPIEIERRGKKGSTNTTYELFPLEKDNKTVADFPDKQELLGSLILDLNYEECQEVVAGTYTLPGNDNANTSQGERGRRQQKSEQAPAPRTRNRAKSEEADATPKANSEAPSGGRQRGSRTRRSQGTDSF